MSHFLCRSSTADGYSWALTSVTSFVFNKGVLIKVCLRWWFYPQQAGNSNAKCCMGMNVLNAEWERISTGFVVEQKHVSPTAEPFDSGILTPSRSVWLICFFGASPALVVSAEELEQPGSDSPWLHGIPHLWWGEGPASEIHSQTWQVRGNSASKALLGGSGCHHWLQQGWHRICVPFCSLCAYSWAAFKHGNLL